MLFSWWFNRRRPLLEVTFPATNSPKPNSTLLRTLQSPGGQTFTINRLMIAQSFLLCSDWLRCVSEPKSFAVFCASFSASCFLSGLRPAKCPNRRVRSGYVVQILRCDLLSCSRVVTSVRRVRCRLVHGVIKLSKLCWQGLDICIDRALSWERKTLSIAAETGQSLVQTLRSMQKRWGWWDTGGERSHWRAHSHLSCNLSWICYLIR